MTKTYAGGIEEILEVKPETFLDHPKNKAKISALNSFCRLYNMNAILIESEEYIERMEKLYLEVRNDSIPKNLPSLRGKNRI